MSKAEHHLTVDATTPTPLVDVLARHTGISKIKLKDAMQKGAVWIARGQRAAQRVRRATSTVQRGDRLSLYYDTELLQRTVPPARLLWAGEHYSAWYKPAGMLAQGTQYGDHLALLRVAEQALPRVKTTYLVHRLDREADGIMLIAHSSTAAAALSALFAQQLIEKRYRIRVKGRPSSAQGQIDSPLDGKPAFTLYELQEYDPATDSAVVAVTIKTGRTHQIRRHFDAIGHPIIGDPKYGTGNKNTAGMQLTAVSLRFTCPLGGGMREFDLDALSRQATDLRV
jgi:tRNA pseudouridine32 synthase/23S rRNA pseudouridine746 synthase